VIPLEKSDEWNLCPVKRRILEKKKKDQGLKSKRGETSFDSMFQKEKRKRRWDLQAAGRDSIEIK
jgi:hypothetical protein